MEWMFDEWHILMDPMPGRGALPGERDDALSKVDVTSSTKPKVAPARAASPGTHPAERDTPAPATKPARGADETSKPPQAGPVAPRAPTSRAPTSTGAAAAPAPTTTAVGAFKKAAEPSKLSAAERQQLRSEQERFFAVPEHRLDYKPSLATTIWSSVKHALGTDEPQPRATDFFQGRDHWITKDGGVIDVRNNMGAVQLQQSGSTIPTIERAFVDLSDTIGEPAHSHFGSPTRPKLNGPDAPDVVADATVTIFPDGSISRSIERQSAGENVHRTTSVWDKAGPHAEHQSAGRATAIYASRPDGSRAVILEGGKNNEPVDYDVTMIDASGLVVSSNGYPKPADIPRTLDDLRTAQDRAALHVGASVEPAPAASIPLTADAVFSSAADSLRSLNARADNILAVAGAKLIAGEPGALEAFAEPTYADIRQQFTQLGLSAVHGNEAIDRDWRKHGLGLGAQYVLPGKSGSGDRLEFGTGDADTAPMAMSRDIIAHEAAHRIIIHNGFADEMINDGAISESLADTMAVAVDTRHDWTIGEDVIVGGIRDMSRPTRVSDLRERAFRASDDGIHDVASVPNYAAYLIGSKVGQESMGKIYADTIREHLKPGMDFRDLAAGTWRSAVKLYGADSSEASAVRAAWDDVLELRGDATLFDAR